jgi:hypothetical protein
MRLELGTNHDYSIVATLAQIKLFLENFRKLLSQRTNFCEG